MLGELAEPSKLRLVAASTVAHSGGSSSVHEPRAGVAGLRACSGNALAVCSRPGSAGRNRGRKDAIDPVG